MPIAIYNAMQADDTRTVNLLVAIMTITALSVIFIISRIGKKRKTQNV
jgi:ABC-type molybdate transport system permease subunit